MSQATPEQIAGWIVDARARTYQLFDDLDDEQLRVPPLDVVNPLLWELGHIGWFQEKFALRLADGSPSMFPRADELYDSSAVGHEQRWGLDLPHISETRGYLSRVRDAILDRLGDRDLAGDATDLILLALFHEDMHAEAFAYMRNSLGYAAPGRPPGNRIVVEGGGPLPGDVQVPGGTLLLGAPRDGGFALDNEQWAHPVRIEPFSIARAPVTQGEFVRFVSDGGYAERSLWSTEGWAWKTSCAAEHPVCFRRDSGGGWLRRHYDTSGPLLPDRPMIHVNFYEAEAYCRFVGRRLPTEAEWEAAAAGEPTADGNALAETKRRYPWGNDVPGPEHGNLDGDAGDTVDVGAHAAGDSAFGCRQMLGNVWEWTSTVFAPYPGFRPGPYADYSAPWFGTRRVLRGGAWATRSRLIRNTWRNYYTTERRDVFAGFRTCALAP
jgi:iron(II)-dependent oxidoreductase